MAISYANVPLTVPTPELVSWVAANLTLADIADDYGRIYFPSKLPTYFQWPGVNPDSPVELNQLRWPVGASRWATFFALVTDAQLAAIRAVAQPGGMQAAQPLVLTWWDAAANAEVARISPSMYMLPARPLATIANLPQPLRQMWLLPLVDDRFYWWQRSTGELTAQSTWATELTTIATALGLVLTADTVSGNYSTPPSSFGFHDEYASVALDGAAYSCGQRVVRRLDGSVLTLTATSSQTIVGSNILLPAARSVVAGGQFSATDGAASLPATITVAFPLTLDSVVQDAMYEQTGALSPTGNSFTRLYHHSLVATRTTAGGGTPTNSATLSALATQLGSDLYKWLVPVYDLKYAGIVPWVAEGQHDVIWTHRADEVSTRVMPAPFNDFLVSPGPSSGGSYTGPVTFTSTVTISGSGVLIIGTTSSTTNYALWIDTDTCTLKYRCGGSTYTIPQSGTANAKLTHVTGTTTDAYVTVLDLVDSNGIHGAWGLKNTGGSYDMLDRWTGVDMWSTSTTAVAPNHTPGEKRGMNLAEVDFAQSVITGGVVPYQEIKLELKSASVGNATTYELYVSQPST